MKQCTYTQQDIIRYLRNRMTREEETAFQEHLLECEHCSVELIQLRRCMKEFGRHNIPMARWVLIASIACSLAAGSYIITREDVAPSGKIDVQPPLYDDHGDLDSLRNDSISIDSMRIRIEE